MHRQGTWLFTLSIALVLLATGPVSAEETELKFVVPRQWNIDLPKESPQPLTGIVPAPLVGREGFLIDRPNRKIDANGDGIAEKSWEKWKEGRTLVLRGKGAHGQRCQRAIRLIAQSRTQTGPNFNLWMSVGVLTGKVDGVEVGLIDQNNNGVYGDYGEDAMVVDGSTAATFLSKIIRVNEKLYQFQVHADGSKATWNLYDGKVGTLELGKHLRSKLDIEFAVLLDDVKGLSFMADGHPLEIPPGTYELATAKLSSGKGAVTRVRPGSMDGFRVVAGQTTTPSWGPPKGSSLVGGIDLLYACDHTEDIALGDLDGDGDLDVVTANIPYRNGVLEGRPGIEEKGRNRVFLNNGDGTFSENVTSTLREAVESTSQVVIADFNGDEKQDVFFANRLDYGKGCANRLYLNRGAGQFEDVSSSHLPRDAEATVTVAIGDIDGDRDQDIICGNAPLWKNDRDSVGAQVRLYLNNGKGKFKDATKRLLPKHICAAQSVRLCDVDGDKALDLIIAPDGFKKGQETVLFRNSGKKVFSPSKAEPLPLSGRVFSIEVADIDGDGDVDLTGVTNQGLQVLLNRTVEESLALDAGVEERFKDDSLRFFLPANSFGIWPLTYADFDADGDPDILCSVSVDGVRQSLALNNDGKGRFTQGSSLTPSQWGPFQGDRQARPTDFAVGDLDGDGRADILLAGELREHPDHKYTKVGGQTRVFKAKGAKKQSPPEFLDVTSEAFPFEAWVVGVHQANLWLLGVAGEEYYDWDWTKYGPSPSIVIRDSESGQPYEGKQRHCGNQLVVRTVPKECQAFPAITVKGKHPALGVFSIEVGATSAPK